MKHIVRDIFPVDASYTHFAINSDNKVVTGWDYSQCERTEISMYSRMDLKDMFPDVKPSSFKVLTKKHIQDKMQINPFVWESWVK